MKSSSSAGCDGIAHKVFAAMQITFVDPYKDLFTHNNWWKGYFHNNLTNCNTPNPIPMDGVSSLLENWSPIANALKFFKNIRTCFSK